MKRLVRWFSISIVLMSVAVVASCGGGSGVTLTFPGGSALAIDQGQTITINVTATGDGGAGVTWTCTGTACTTLASVTTASVTFNATGGTGTATITATSIKSTTVSKSVTIAVNALPGVTTTQAQLTAAPATAGVAYSFTFTATGGSGTLSWSAAGLSDGLSISSGTGAITGTPTAKGTVTFTVTVKDSSAAGPQSNTTATLTITVNNPPAPTITTTQAQLTAAPATAGSVYGFTFHGSGTGTLTWSATGLPADGLSLAAGTGIVSGTPTSQASLSIIVTVSDAFGQSSAATPFTITVNNPPAPTIATTQAQVTAAGPGIVGTAYSFTFHDTGTGTLTWSAVGLPADGLSLNASTGVVSGTPTTKQPVPFTLKVSDTFGQSSAVTAFTITVSNPPSVLGITKTHTGNFTQGQVGATYTVTVSNGAGAGPTDGTTVTVTDTLPTGLTLVSMAGTGWTCVTNACTRTDVLAAGSSYPAITVTVNVAANAATPQVNQVSVSGGGNVGTASTSDSTTIIEPVLGITKTHTGNFAQGQAGATYTVTVSNTGTAPTSGKITVTETVPSGLTLSGMAGTGWTCPGTGGATTCDRSDALAGSGASYPTITVTVNVGASATSPQVNQVSASGGGSVTASTSDSTTINTSAANCGSGSESLLSGQYAMALRGFDASGPVGIGGTFDLDGAGHVAKLVGVEDINSSDVAGVQTNLSITSASSSYSVGSDHRGCLTIVTSAGTQKFRFSLGAISGGVASTGHVVEFDATGSNASGALAKQDSAAFLASQISGNYAFGVSGPLLGGGKFAAVGMLSFNGGGGIGTSSVVDFDSNGSVDNNGTTYPTSPISITSGGTYSISANGRGTMSFTPSGSPAVGSILYVVSSSELLILSSDSQTVDNLFVGSALQQSGSFSGSSLNATTVLYATGLGNSSGSTNSRVSTGFLTPSGGTNFSFSGLQNDGGNFKTESGSGTYSIASNGRAAFSAGSGGAPIVYLVSANKGFVMLTDGSGTVHVESGFIEPQSGSSFSASSASGTYAFGTIQPEDTGVDESTGFAAFDGAGNITGTSDDNSSGTLTGGQTFTDTYSVDSNGTGHIPSGCTIGATSTTCDNIFLIISSTKAVLFKTKASNTNPDLQIAER